MGDLTVSVIVPVYNARDYVSACVESIIAQTYERLQIILVDDGSTDGSGAVCDDLAARDSRIVVIHRSNGGIAAAQNSGLDVATGALITFCDNDDLMSPTMISRLASVLEDADADMSCCRWISIGASDAAARLAAMRATPPPAGHVEVFADPAVAYQTVFSAFLRRLGGNELRYFSEANWGKLYRAEMFEGIRFPEGRYAQDVAIAMPLYLRMRRVASCSDALYLWLQRGDSVSHSLRATTYYADIVGAHAHAFEAAAAHGILPARAYFGLGAVRRERRSIASVADRAAYERDRRRVQGLKRSLSVVDRLRCQVLSLLRRAEVLVYDMTVHRRR